MVLGSPDGEMKQIKVNAYGARGLHAGRASRWRPGTAALPGAPCPGTAHVHGCIPRALSHAPRRPGTAALPGAPCPGTAHVHGRIPRALSHAPRRPGTAALPGLGPHDVFGTSHKPWAAQEITEPTDTIGARLAHSSACGSIGFAMTSLPMDLLGLIAPRCGGCASGWRGCWCACPCRGPGGR